MYQLCTDEKVWEKFWIDERENTPRWMADGNATWHCSWEDFRDFCYNSERIYLIDDVALLYVEKTGEIHFSLLREHPNIDIIESLTAIRDELLKDYPMIFGWVGKHNRGLRKIIETCGLKYQGFQMFHGESHGKVLEWRCYILASKTQ